VGGGVGGHSCRGTGLDSSSYMNLFEFGSFLPFFVTKLQHFFFQVVIRIACVVRNSCVLWTGFAAFCAKKITSEKVMSEIFFLHKNSNARKDALEKKSPGPLKSDNAILSQENFVWLVVGPACTPVAFCPEVSWPAPVLLLVDSQKRRQATKEVVGQSTNNEMWAAAGGRRGLMAWRRVARSTSHPC